MSTFYSSAHWNLITSLAKFEHTKLSDSQTLATTFNPPIVLQTTEGLIGDVQRGKISPTLYFCLHYFFVDVITHIALSCKLRQQCVAQSIYYFKFCYSKERLTEFDPWLAAPSALFLAAKSLETNSSTLPVRIIEAIKSYTSEKLDIVYPYDESDLQEGQVRLIVKLDFNLHFFLPYNYLLFTYNSLLLTVNPWDSESPLDLALDIFEKQDLHSPTNDNNLEMGLESETTHSTSEISADVKQTSKSQKPRYGKDPVDLRYYIFYNAWTFLNDVFRTDLILRFPPHILAMSALYLALFSQPSEWFTGPEGVRPLSEIKLLECQKFFGVHGDLSSIWRISKEIMGLYINSPQIKAATRYSQIKTKFRLIYSKVLPKTPYSFEKSQAKSYFRTT